MTDSWMPMMRTAWPWQINSVPMADSVGRPAVSSAASL